MDVGFLPGLEDAVLGVDRGELGHQPGRVRLRSALRRGALVPRGPAIAGRWAVEDGIVTGVLGEIEVVRRGRFVSGVGVVEIGLVKAILATKLLGHRWNGSCDRMTPPAGLRRAVGGRRHGAAQRQPWSVLPSSRNSSED